MQRFDNDINRYNFNIQQEKLIRRNQDKINQLYREKQRFLEKNEKEIKQIEAEIDQIQNITYLNMEDSFKAIAYLVSKMENKPYSCFETTICLFEQANDPAIGGYPNPIYYKLIYLAKNGEEEKAIKEIKERFRIRKLNPQEWDYYGNQAFLDMASSNYIQLAYLKDTDNHWNDFLIHYNHDNKSRNVSSEKKQKLYTTICDERYSYIVSYIDMVVNYRLYRPNLDITLNEMLLLADEFIKDYKKSKVKKRLK